MNEIRSCLECGDKYVARRKRRKFCSLRCSAINAEKHIKRYPKIIKYCKDCKKVITRRAKRCSKCNLKFRYKNTKTAQKISVTFKKKYPGHSNVTIICKYCGKKKDVNYNMRDQEFCSISCSSKYNWTKENYRNNISHKFDERIEKGLHKGWPHRNKFYKSYAEKFFSKVLKSRKIKYEFNKKEGMYFIDFAIDKKMIALEIDGKQHLRRKTSDDKKDKLLRSRGWKVYRIKWRQPQKIKPEINKFLTFYNKK